VAARSASAAAGEGFPAGLPDPTSQNLLNSFMQGLRKLGYAEERNLRVEERCSPSANKKGVGVSFFLKSLPLVSAFLIVVIPSVAAMCGPLLVRRTVALEHLAANNEVAGFKFAVLGVVYAVLLGFAVIVVWEKFRDAEAAVVQEASGVVAISRLLEGLDAGSEGVVRQRLTGYVQAVIADDWPTMARGKMSPRVDQALNALYLSVLTVNPGTPRESATMAALLTELDVITQGRRTRLVLAPGVVPGVLWTVLFAGAVVTLTFTVFFGTRSVRAQALMNGMLAAVIFMGLFAVVEIDHPFTGPVSVGPEAMQLALDAFNDTR